MLHRKVKPQRAVLPMQVLRLVLQMMGMNQVRVAQKLPLQKLLPLRVVQRQVVLLMQAQKLVLQRVVQRQVVLLMQVPKPELQKEKPDQ